MRDLGRGSLEVKTGPKPIGDCWKSIRMCQRQSDTGAFNIGVSIEVETGLSLFGTSYSRESATVSETVQTGPLNSGGFIEVKTGLN